MIYARRYRGQKITDICQLKDGMSVQAFHKESRRWRREPIKDGYVKIHKPDCYSYFPERYDISIIDRGGRTNRINLGTVNAPYSNDFRYYDIYKVNRFKEKQSMANKLMALVRLNKNQRKLTKVGIYDENGNLTDDGQEVLLNLVAKEYEPKLIELVKDWKDGKKRKCDEEDD
jgi:hypothetical protein